MTLRIYGAIQKVAHDNIKNKTVKSMVILKCLRRHVKILKEIKY